MKNMLILSLVCFTFILMNYGLIFLGHAKHCAKKQRDEIAAFAQKQKRVIDKFISFDKAPDISVLRPGDTVFCYSWDCLCSERAILRQMIQHFLKQKTYIYSATSKYCIDKSLDLYALVYGFDMYEDIWSTFISYKNTLGAKTRVKNGHAPGRPHGARNYTHILDGKESVVLDMHNKGFSMYAIAKKLQTSAPTIKRFLVSQG